MNIFEKILKEIPKHELIYDDMSFELSNLIYQITKQRNIKSDQLADMLDVSEQKVLDFYVGEVDLKFLSKILAALDLKIQFNILPN